jgi:hypothetical protein
METNCYFEILLLLLVRPLYTKRTLPTTASEQFFFYDL